MLCLMVACFYIRTKKICDLVCVHFLGDNMAFYMCQMLLYMKVHIYCTIYCVEVIDSVEVMGHIYNTILIGLP